MKTIGYKVNIVGLKNKGGSIPILAFREITDALLKGCDRVLRLFFEGSSTKGGKAPDWLKKSLNFIITGIKTGSTILEIEAPVLGESIPKQFIQKKFCGDSLEQDDTALSLLSKSISDASNENLESDLLDVGVLDTLLSFNTITTKYAEELIISSETKKKEEFRISNEEVKKIKKIKIETPGPHTIVISGFLNLIEHINRRFQLKLEEGKRVEGTIDLSLVDSENVRELWGKRVTIKGKAIYKPSGKLRRIEAQLVRPFEPGDETLQKIPKTRKRVKFTKEFLIEEKSNSEALRRIWGKWPGDEPIEELFRDRCV